MLLKAIFTEEARNVCSVGGRTATGKGAKQSEARPPLHQDGVEAIIGKF